MLNLDLSLLFKEVPFQFGSICSLFRYALTDMRKLANRMKFGTPEESSLGNFLTLFFPSHFSLVSVIQFSKICLRCRMDLLCTLIDDKAFDGIVCRGWFGRGLWNAWTSWQWKIASLYWSEQTCCKGCQKVSVLSFPHFDNINYPNRLVIDIFLYIFVRPCPLEKELSIVTTNDT